MPTKRPRHVLTETPEIERALKLASKRWPAEKQNPSRLLLHLVQEGEHALELRDEQDVEKRREAVRRTAGTIPYPPNYLEELRRDWPE